MLRKRPLGKRAGFVSDGVGLAYKLFLGFVRVPAGMAFGPR